MSAIEKNKISANIVFHRKSARRKIGRDIFLVFEKPPRRIRSKRAKRKLKSKSMCGHVDLEKSKKIGSNNLKNTKFTEKTPNNNQSEKKSKLSFNSKLVPRVNPIFLWVKQENTTIVEVRCEDYDKQNRIRITKTKHGWKAFPRSDSTSSRVVNVIHSPLCLVTQMPDENVKTIDERNKSFPKDLLISNLKVEKVSDEVNCSENELLSNSIFNNCKENGFHQVESSYSSDQDISFNVGIFDIENEELKNSNVEFTISDNEKLEDSINTNLVQNCDDSINRRSESIDSLIKNNIGINTNDSNLTKEAEIKKCFYSCNENASEKQEINSNKNNYTLCPTKCLPINSFKGQEDFGAHTLTEACATNLRDIHQSLNQQNEFTNKSISLKNDVNLYMNPVNSNTGRKLDKLYEPRNQNLFNILSNWEKGPTTTCVETTNDESYTCLLDRGIQTDNSKSILEPFNPYRLKPMDIETGKQNILANSNNYKTISKQLEINTISPSDSYCSYVHNLVDQYSNTNIDPDPLTQLQLLMKNAEWKIPDPILVPKHRLSAILASPAREIPLLLTTMPELSNTKAFNCPEILQNPNILIVSMKQLETILKRNLQYDKLNFQKPNATQQKFDLPDKFNGTKNSCSFINSKLNNDFNMESVIDKIIHTPYIDKYEPYKCQTTYKNNLFPLFCQNQFEVPNNEICRNQNTLNNQNLMACTEEPIEVSIYQDICQNQLENYFNMNPLAAEIFLRKQPKSYENQVDSDSDQPNFIAFNKNNAVPQSFCDSYYNQSYENNSSESEFHLNKPTNTEILVNNCKPKLSCRSLSKLLEPNHRLMSDFFVNVSSHMKKPNSTFKNNSQNGDLKKDSHSLLPPEISVSYFDNGTSIKSYESDSQLKLNTHFDTADTFVKDTDFSDKTTNPMLWHPLFGSKSSSSQWQWTTISAIND